MKDQSSEARISDCGEALVRSGIVRDMSPEEITELATISQVSRFPKGSTILEEDAKSRDLYLIREGRVSIQVNLPGETSRDEVMYTMRDNQIFGELSLVDAAPRSATVQSEDDVTVYLFDYQKIIALLDDKPRIGYLLMRNIAGIISNRVRTTNMMWRNTLIW